MCGILVAMTCDFDIGARVMILAHRFCKTSLLKPS